MPRLDGRIKILKGSKLEEQLMYATDNLNLGLFPLFYVINEDVWQTLPEDIQEAAQRYLADHRYVEAVLYPQSEGEN